MKFELLDKIGVRVAVSVRLVPMRATTSIAKDDPRSTSIFCEVRDPAVVLCDDDRRDEERLEAG